MIFNSHIHISNICIYIYIYIYTCVYTYIHGPIQKPSQSLPKVLSTDRSASLEFALHNAMNAPEERRHGRSLGTQEGFAGPQHGQYMASNGWVWRCWSELNVSISWCNLKMLILKECLRKIDVSCLMLPKYVVWNVSSYSCEAEKKTGAEEHLAATALRRFGWVPRWLSAPSVRDPWGVTQCEPPKLCMSFPTTY